MTIGDVKMTMNRTIYFYKIRIQMKFRREMPD